MGNRRIFILLTGIILAGIFTYAYAQWPNYPDSRIPRMKDGKRYEDQQDHQEWQHVLLSVRFEAVRG